MAQSEAPEAFAAALERALVTRTPDYVARAREMAHVPLGGADGIIARLASVKLGDARRVFTHINNTNPVLRADSPERAHVERAGWEIAFDGMEMTL